ncbi:glutamate racemase [Candidatus Saccharibacteria bacterium]|nr:glutamate racemase [Candidatus Saccharibacteria bacterium]
MKKTDPICIFDSGIGGVSVLQSLATLAPNESYFYYSDSKNCPYGEKSTSEIQKICDKITKYLLEKHPKCIIIACNTASAKAANYLREKYPNTKFFAIEPAYKLARNEKTLVMATPGTLESEKFHKLFYQYDNGKTILLPCPGLASLIENGTPKEIEGYLQKKIATYRGRVEVVVLGCTHYPLAKEYIKNVLGEVKLIDGAPYLAENVVKFLTENKLKNNLTSPEIVFEDSNPNPKIANQKAHRFKAIFAKS